jgi:hypothetical protein
MNITLRNAMMLQTLSKRTFMTTPELFVWGAVTAVNVVNMRTNKLDLATAKLFTFCVVKGGIYAFTSPFSLIGIVLTLDRLNTHLIPASVYCKHLNPK